MKKQIIIGDKIFKTQTECENYIRSILKEIGIINSVKNNHSDYFNFLSLLCKRHPHYDEKFKNFIDFKICCPVLNKRGLELNIVNNDGTNTEISWRICVSGKCRTPEKLFSAALRQSVSTQIYEFKCNTDLSYCRECYCSLIEKNLHVDHYEKQFIQLVEEFLKLNKDTIIIPTDYTKQLQTFETKFLNKDEWIGKLFEKYHLDNATLRVLCENCNLTRKKYKK